MTPIRRRALDWLTARRAVAAMGDPPAMLADLDAARWRILDDARAQWAAERAAKGALSR